MKAMAKYIDFEVLEAGTDFDAHTWQDSYLVAKKPEKMKNLEDKMNSLENKLKLIMSKLDIK